ncbi:hypothetical protein HRbin41_01423 [bacterium HR41]|nr:hypothetical protein HRbin41_01423 [bacterium HR41]
MNLRPLDGLPRTRGLVHLAMIDWPLIGQGNVAGAWNGPCAGSRRSATRPRDMLYITRSSWQVPDACASGWPALPIVANTVPLPTRAFLHFWARTFGSGLLTWSSGQVGKYLAN